MSRLRPGGPSSTGACCRPGGAADSRSTASEADGLISTSGCSGPSGEVSGGSGSRVGETRGWTADRSRSTGLVATFTLVAEGPRWSVDSAAKVDSRLVSTDRAVASVRLETHAIGSAAGPDGRLDALGAARAWLAGPSAACHSTDCATSSRERRADAAGPLSGGGSPDGVRPGALGGGAGDRSAARASGPDGAVISRSGTAGPLGVPEIGIRARPDRDGLILPSRSWRPLCRWWPESDGIGSWASSWGNGRSGSAGREQRCRRRLLPTADNRAGRPVSPADPRGDGVGPDRRHRIRQSPVSRGRQSWNRCPGVRLPERRPRHHTGEMGRSSQRPSDRTNPTVQGQYTTTRGEGILQPGAPRDRRLVASHDCGDCGGSSWGDGSRRRRDGPPRLTATRLDFWRHRCHRTAPGEPSAHSFQQRHRSALDRS